MEPTIAPEATATFVEEMTRRMAALARSLGEWGAAAPRTLEALEERTVALTKELGNALLAGASQLAATSRPLATSPVPAATRRRTSGSDRPGC